MARPKMDIALVVRTLLTYKGKQQADLADYMNVTPGVISKALSGGRRKWTVADLDAMAEFLEVPVETLLRDPATLFNQPDAELRAEVTDLARTVRTLLGTRVAEMADPLTGDQSRRATGGSR